MKKLLITLIIAFLEGCDSNQSQPQSISHKRCNLDLEKQQYLTVKYGQAVLLPIDAQRTDRYDFLINNGTEIYYVHYNSETCDDYSYVKMFTIGK